MAKVIMIQGTMSNVGKSLITAGLCRIFAQDGYKTAPFKSQNMALNSYITKEGLEMGRAQVMQAEAAGTKPDVRMNPILLKPTTDVGSQVIVNGNAIGNMKATDYFKYKHKLIPDIMNAFDSLCKDYDIVVIEGAGSPSEINLKKDDIVNMGMAKMANAPVLLVGDIDRGGVFAQLVGTVMLLEKDEASMIKGTIINKFRGDKSILESGLTMLEEKIKIPVIGVTPYMDIDIDDEDSLSERLSTKKEVSLIDIAVIKLPRISNFTDFNCFERMKNVSLRYISNTNEFKNPDMVIIPGTKSTISDLRWLRQSGLEALILKHANKNKPIFGICGGYQMLGEELADPYNVECGGSIKGIGLLPIKTIFEKEKVKTNAEGTITNIEGIFSRLKDEKIKGYEIHMGSSCYLDERIKPLTKINGKNEGASKENIYGSYVHGIFDMDSINQKIIECLCERKGISIQNIEKINYEEYKQQQYDLLADELRKNLDMKMIYKILKEGI